MENCHCHQNWSLPQLVLPLPSRLVIILSLRLNQVFQPCISGEGVYHLHGCWTRLSSFTLSSPCYLSGHHLATCQVIIIVFNVMSWSWCNRRRCHEIKLSFLPRIAETCWSREPTAVLSVEPTSLMSSTSIDVEIYYHSLSGIKSVKPTILMLFSSTKKWKLDFEKSGMYTMWENYTIHTSPT